jgi:predicted kinase
LGPAVPASCAAAPAECGGGGDRRLALPYFAQFAARACAWRGLASPAKPGIRAADFAHKARNEQSRRIKSGRSTCDTIERAIVAGEQAVLLGEKGYRVAYAVADDNLCLGRTVIADSVNPLEITRSAWRDVAKRVGAKAVEIEVVCSDQAEHRHRIETRAVDVPVSWDEVVTRRFEAWITKHIRIDTAGQNIEQSFAALRQMLPTKLRP